MSAYTSMKLRYNPVDTYAGTTQNNYVGSQTVAGRRTYFGALPTFNNTNAYSISKSGSDSNAGTSAAPFLTLNKVFGTTVAVTTDKQAGNTATMTGTVNGYHYPETIVLPAMQSGGISLLPTASQIPAPQTCNTVADFSQGTGNYLTLPAGLSAAFASKSAYCFDGWFYLITTPGSASNWVIVEYRGTGQDNSISINNSLQLSFRIGGTVLNSGTNLNRGQWYYFACVFTSGAAGGKQIWLGASPETAVLANSATQTAAFPSTAGNWYMGHSSSLTNSGGGLLTRIACSVGTTWPILASDTNCKAVYAFETAPLIQSAPKSYVVIQDSGTYSELTRLPFKYDMSASLGIYAADGQAPTISNARGVPTGLYGTNNTATSAALPGTTNYYINGVTGNDGTGTRNNPALPFKTIQAALANGSRVSGDVLQIVASATYSGDLTLGAFNTTIFAGAGIQAVLTPGASGTHLTCGGAYTYNLQNLIFLSPSGILAQTLFDQTATAVNLADCQIQGYGYVRGANLGASIPATYTRCLLSRAQNLQTTATTNDTYTNCYFSGSGSLFTMNINGSSSAVVSFNACTFASLVLNWHTAGTGYSQNILCNSASMTNVQGSATVTGTVYFYSMTVNNGVIDFTTNTSSGTNPAFVCYMNDVLQMGYNLGKTGLGFGSSTIAAYAYCALKNCVAVGNSVNFGFFAKSNGGTTAMNVDVIAENCVSTNAGTTGFLLNGSGSSSSPAAYYSSCFDSGSASGESHSGSNTTVATSNFYTGVSITSSSYGVENITLPASSALLFAGTNGQRPIGYDRAIMSLNSPGALTVNGLNFTCSTFASVNGQVDTNTQAGLLVDTTGGPVTCQYCTFTGCTGYGINPSPGSTIQGCLFECNGHGIACNASNLTATYNAAYECGGSGLVNYNVNASVTHLSTYACAYGIYDSSGAVTSSGNETANILASSSIYDYSGPNTMTYSDVGTLDPASTGGLDANSTTLDPLFRNVLSGDLRLQAIEAGYFFDSPAKGAGPGGVDMGAFSFTYGTLSQTWTEIDFSDTDSTGPATGPYRNPDSVPRNYVPIHLSEGDREDGVPYSVASTIKLELTLTWNQSANDMPTAQTNALRAMFAASTNKIQIDAGGLVGVGAGWLDAYFLRAIGFEYQDFTGSFADSTVPTPVREVTVRLI